VIEDATLAPPRSAPASVKLAGLRCAVLGAGGFLGGALASALCDRGAVVRGYGRLANRSGRDERIVWTNAELSDTPSLASALDGQQVVFHCIGSSLPATSNENPAAALLDDVHGTLELLDLCVATGVTKVIFASSGGTVYGVPPLVPTPETAPTNPISAYGINKLTIEKYLALYHRLHGLEYRVLRIANPYGPGQSPLRPQGVVASMVRAALSGAAIEIWGTGEVTRDFLYVDDVVDVLLRSAAYEGPERVFNVGSGVGRTVNDILAAVQDAFDGAPLEVVRKPGRIADVPVSVLDPALARRAFGWEPTVGLREGILNTAAWMRAALSDSPVPLSRDRRPLPDAGST
jgi:UDP-glucose 4-epimerase